MLYSTHCEKEREIPWKLEIFYKCFETWKLSAFWKNLSNDLCPHVLGGMAIVFPNPAASSLGKQGSATCGAACLCSSQPGM